MKAGGIALATTTVRGYDWTYDQIEKPALVYTHRGYWTAKWKTVDTPLFTSNEVMLAEIKRQKLTMLRRIDNRAWILTNVRNS